MCAICKVLPECQNKPENKVSTCKVCGKTDKCNLVRNGMCLDCWIKEKKEKNPMVFNTPTVDDIILYGKNGR